MSFSTKRSALVIFTIHYLELPEPSTDSYQIEWKRGKNKGYSEKMFAQDNTVIFDKKFRFKSTFYFNKQNVCKPKILNIKVLRFIESSSSNLKKPKIFGKVAIDLANYYSSNCPLTSRYTLESAHKKKSTIVVTTSIKFCATNAEMQEAIDADTSATLSSISDAMQLASDHESSWDVSTIAPPNQESSSKGNDSDSLIVKKSTKSQEHPLKQFELTEEQRIENMKKHKALVMHEKQEKPINEDRESEEATLSRLDSFLSSSAPQVDQTTGRLKEKRISQSYISYQASLNLLKSSVCYPWSRTPVTITATIRNEKKNNNNNSHIEYDTKVVPSYPKPSSALFGAIISSEMLKKNSFRSVYYDSLVRGFFDKLKERKFVFQCTPADYFNVLIHLSALLRKETKKELNLLRKEKEADKISDDDDDDDNTVNDDQSKNNFKLDTKVSAFLIDKTRYKSFYKQLMEETKESFLSFCFKLSERFDYTIRMISNPEFDPGRIIDDFRKLYSEILSMDNIEKEIIDIIADYVVMILDSRLIDYLLNYPNLCVLTNAMAWNYLITLMEGELPIFKFTLFKEASAVITLSHSICEDPTKVEEIASHLPKWTVYKLLLSQVPCEYVRELPDPKPFYMQYSKQIRTEIKSLENASADSSSESISSKEESERDSFNLPTKMPLPIFNKFKKMISIIDTSNWKNVWFDENDRMKFSFIDEIFPVEESKDDNTVQA